MVMRASVSEIQRARQNRSAVVFLTGATGFVGSHVAASLLRDGYRVVVLARAGKEHSARERVRRVLEWHGIESGPELQIVEGELSRERLGCAPADFLDLARQVDEIVHCGSYTSFQEKDKETTYEINVGGTRRVLELAQAGCCSVIHYLSTAYCVGKVVGLCLESWREPEGFHNAYEASKNKAEKLLIDACEGSGIRLSIYRPSVIIGDSKRGRTLLFNAMYYPVKVAEYLANEFRKDFAENQGRLASRLGIRQEPDGTLEVPIRFDTGTDTGGVINLVPIDFVVEAFRAIMTRAADSGMYHLVNKHPCTLETLVAWGQHYLGLKGSRVCTAEVFPAAPKTALERRYENFCRVYLPYMSDSRQFDTARADAILEADSVVRCPEVDYEMFRRCMDYAVACRWRNPLECHENAVSKNNVHPA